MKKIFTLFAALMMVFSMNAATKTIYCKMAQSWWKTDGAAVGAYYWGTGSGPAWPGVRMTPVAGETDLWSIDIDTDKFQKIIFTRVNGSGAVSDWGAKTADLTVPTDDKNLYTITSTSPVWGNPGVAGNWSVYAPDAPKTYKDITITIVANATPKIHYWEGGDKVVGTVYANMPEMVATGEENTYSYTIKEVDEATGVKYLVVVGEVQSADQQAFEDVNKNFKELLPQVSVMGVTSWDGDKMTVADDYLTASVTLTLEAAKDYQLKLTVNGEWFGSKAITITKDNNSASFAENGDGNGKLTTDLAGDYVFTYTYATKTLVVTYPEPEPELQVMDIEMTNLVVEEMEGFLVLTASDDDNTGLNVMLALNADGTLNTEVSYMALIQGWNEVELPIVEGAITKTYNEELATDVYTGLIVVEYMEGKLGLNLTMYAKPVVVTDVVVTDATITVETEDDGMGGTYEIINVTANWNESVLKLEGIEKEFEGFVQIKETFVVDGEEDWSIWMCMNGVITTVDNVLTVTGEFKDNNNGDVYNVTISGKLPVVEPTTITYELNGGELPTATVPTQDSLIAAFKDGYNAYFGVSVATTRVIDNFLYAGAAVNNPTCDVSLFMKDDASPWKWLGDYVLAVTNAQIEAGLLVNLKELATELMWRQSLTGFFLQQAKLDSNYKGNADFTEAGKPEAWGAAYQAAHAVVLPTEPVAEDYTLPTPTKEGYTFVGWYDNAAGEGEAYKVIPAGWAGTLYAIWKANGPTTDLDNIAVEGKAVKAIINGQLIIIKNGVQYNVQGAILK